MRKSAKSYLPGIGYGVPSEQTLIRCAGVTAATQNLDAVDFENFTIQCEETLQGGPETGACYCLQYITFAAENLGTGGSSGNWTLAIQKNGTTVASGQIAYNASTLKVDVDARDNTGLGVFFNRGDVMSLAVTGVPGGSLSGGLQGIKAHCQGSSFGRRTR